MADRVDYKAATDIELLTLATAGDDNAMTELRNRQAKA